MVREKSESAEKANSNKGESIYGHSQGIRDAELRMLPPLTVAA